MIVSLIAVAEKVNMRPDTIWHFIKANNIPTVQNKPRILFDLDDTHPYLTAVKNALKYNLPIFYTMTEIAAILNLDPKTVKKQLNEYDIPIQNEHKRGYVYVTDFLKFADRKQESISSTFLKKIDKIKSKCEDNLNNITG